MTFNPSANQGEFGSSETQPFGCQCCMLSIDMTVWLPLVLCDGQLGFLN